MDQTAKKMKIRPNAAKMTTTPGLIPPMANLTDCGSRLVDCHRATDGRGRASQYRPRDVAGAMLWNGTRKQIRRFKASESNKSGDFGSRFTVEQTCFESNQVTDVR